MGNRTKATYKSLISTAGDELTEPQVLGLPATADPSQEVAERADGSLSGTAELPRQAVSPGRVPVASAPGGEAIRVPRREPTRTRSEAGASRRHRYPVTTRPVPVVEWITQSLVLGTALASDIDELQSRGRTGAARRGRGSVSFAALVREAFAQLRAECAEQASAELLARLSEKAAPGRLDTVRVTTSIPTDVHTAAKAWVAALNRSTRGRPMLRIAHLLEVALEDLVIAVLDGERELPTNSKR